MRSWLLFGWLFSLLCALCLSELQLAQQSPKPIPYRPQKNRSKEWYLSSEAQTPELPPLLLLRSSEEAQYQQQQSEEQGTTSDRLMATGSGGLQQQVSSSGRIETMPLQQERERLSRSAPTSCKNHVGSVHLRIPGVNLTVLEAGHSYNIEILKYNRQDFYKEFIELPYGDQISDYFTHVSSYRCSSGKGEYDCGPNFGGFSSEQRSTFNDHTVYFTAVDNDGWSGGCFDDFNVKHCLAITYRPGKSFKLLRFSDARCTFLVNRGYQGSTNPVYVPAGKMTSVGDDSIYLDAVCEGVAPQYSAYYDGKIYAGDLDKINWLATSSPVYKKRGGVWTIRKAAINVEYLNYGNWSINFEWPGSIGGDGIPAEHEGVDYATMRELNRVDVEYQIRSCSPEFTVEQTTSSTYCPDAEIKFQFHTYDMATGSRTAVFKYFGSVPCLMVLKDSHGARSQMVNMVGLFQVYGSSFVAFKRAFAVPSESLDDAYGHDGQITDQTHYDGKFGGFDLGGLNISKYLVPFLLIYAGTVFKGPIGLALMGAGMLSLTSSQAQAADLTSAVVVTLSGLNGMKSLLDNSCYTSVAVGVILYAMALKRSRFPTKFILVGFLPVFDLESLLGPYVLLLFPPLCYAMWSRRADRLFSEALVDLNISAQDYCWVVVPTRFRALVQFACSIPCRVRKKSARIRESFDKFLSCSHLNARLIQFAMGFEPRTGKFKLMRPGKRNNVKNMRGTLFYRNEYHILKKELSTLSEVELNELYNKGRNVYEREPYDLAWMRAFSWARGRMKDKVEIFTGFEI